MATLWDILELICDGGFLVRSQLITGHTRIGLYKWVDGYCSELFCVGHALFNHLIEIGLIKYWRSGENFEGRAADFFFLRGESPLSN